MIASSPASDHIFQVDNFNALQGLQEQLKNKIFAIEGIRGGEWGLRRSRVGWRGGLEGRAGGSGGGWLGDEG